MDSVVLVVIVIFRGKLFNTPNWNKLCEYAIMLMLFYASTIITKKLFSRTLIYRSFVYLSCVVKNVTEKNLFLQNYYCCIRIYRNSNSSRLVNIHLTEPTLKSCARGHYCTYNIYVHFQHLLLLIER